MDILKLNFTVFTYCGLWWPDETETSLKKKFYTIITILTLTLFYIFTLTQSLDIILGDKSIDEITDNLFMLLTMLSLCFKVTNFLLRRKSVIAMLKTLRKDICRQQNETEAKIQKRFDDIARSNTILFAIFAEMTIVGFTITPILIESYKKRILPFTAWLPYSLSNIFVYWAMYAQQSITMAIAANVNVVSDTLISGLLVQACAQLDILKDRITNIAQPLLALDAIGKPLRGDDIYEDVQSTLEKCIQHHVIIYEFAATVQNAFGWVMFFQFFVSMVTLCSSVFKLSQENTSGVEITSLACYLACMLMQLLFYCWHGNEVKLKSLSVSEAIFSADWTLLQPRTIKSLTILMARSHMPIEITCGSMFTLSLNTYVMVLKTSYSAFNLLQKAR